jgi:hypothetical protein
MNLQKKKRVINDSIGTTIVLLANDPFHVYQKAIGVLTINPTQYNQLHNLSVLVSDVIMSTTSNVGIIIFIHPSFFF